MINKKRLLESLIGYGEWGDGELEEDTNIHDELVDTLTYKANVLDNIHDTENIGIHISEIGDIMNFLNEFKSQLNREKVDLLIKLSSVLEGQFNNLSDNKMDKILNILLEEENL